MCYQKNVDENSSYYDEYYAKEFLIIMDGVISNHSKKWVKEHVKVLNSQWDYVKTLM